MSAKVNLSELIKGTRVFAELDDDSCAAIAKEMREVSFNASQVIFARGDEGKDVYLVADGRVRLSVLTAEGRELSFAHAEKGSLFGEIAMLDGGLRTADATAASKVSAYSLSRGAFNRVMAAHPSVAEAMMHFLCTRIREADQQLEAIALCPIEVRLARFFLAAVRAKVGAECEDELVEVPFTMSQSELALLIGASRPKVNTALSLLEGNGAIKRSGQSITCSVFELEEIAGI
ncbi:MAG: Crp/Fnr family transcriptional regulator [Alphaproteobacteria bacterium]|nr:Crp/Fnr family transcriptional regulator [Alphaproteobacteria bacterium]